MTVHKMEAVWSVVESSVHRMCSGANKCVRGLLVSVGDEVKRSSRLPHFNKRVVILYFGYIRKK